MTKEISLKELVGYRVRSYREKLNLSQSDLSKLSGLNRSYIGSIERGERNVSIENLERIAKGLGIEVWQLFRSD